MMPPSAMMPACTPPNTEVMPARYAVDTIVSPRMAANGSQVTMLWRYASRQPARPAMNDAIAKLNTFTKTTFTPMPAADRSLARTASIAEPNELFRNHATPKATMTSRIRQRNPNSRRGNASPTPMPRSQPNSLGCFTVLPNDWIGWMPNMPVLRNQIVSMPADRARVTTPSVKPRNRNAGRPITTPTTAAAVAAMSGANGNGTPQSNDRELNLHAPTPASAGTAGDTRQAHPRAHQR